MAGSLNKVLLIGNVGRDVEIRATADGRKVATLTLATSDRWTDKSSGEKKERVEWHRIVIFNDRLIEIVEKYVKKGMKLWLEGALQTRKWTDNQGIDRYTAEVVLHQFRGDIQMLESTGSSRPPAPESHDDYGYDSGAAAYRAASRGEGKPVTTPDRDFDDEIPF